MKRGKHVASADAGREVDTLRAISHPQPHPYVLRYVESGLEGNGRLLVATDYFPGRQWCDAIIVASKKALPLVAKAHVIVELLSAIAHVHARGYIHRDIHGGNVLLTVGSYSGPFDDSGTATTAHVKLIDFGNAVRITEAAAPASALLGALHHE